MISKLELKIAYRYLYSKHKNKFISITSAFASIGIMLGVATLIVVMAVMNGYREEITRITLGISGHVFIKGNKNGITNYNELQNKIKTLPNVVSVTPLIEKQVMCMHEGNAAGALMRGIAIKDLSKKSIITEHLVSGNMENFRRTDNAIIIGETLADTLAVNVGDEIKIVTSSTMTTVIGSVPRFKTFIVTGIFRTGSYLYDNALMFTHLPTVQQIFSMQNKVSELEINIQNPLNSEAVTKVVAKEINRKYDVVDWRYQNSSLLSALEIERTVMFLILTLIILVAAFNIISSLYMLVYDKKYDIAILRTIGITRTSIVKIFIIMGSILGIGGTLSGVALGVVFAENINNIKQFLERITATRIFDPVIYYLNNLPSKIEYDDVKNIIIVSLILSVLATIFPAFKAANVNPAEALRNE